ncbi:MAG: ATP-binding protein [Actinomycetota bacterium]|nr:ATP-binding protein [Actinomycetota bacterium]
MSDTPVVVVQGARQVGKSTLVREIATERGMALHSFDDRAPRALAANDPRGFLEQSPEGVAIDEIQRVPELLLDLKASVDRDRRPGRFLICGSANLLRLRNLHDSLAGRAETVDLFGFSQRERERASGRNLVDTLFDAVTVDSTPACSREDYLERICAGSYPEALERRGSRRDAWFESYVERIIDRDAPEVAGLQRLRDLPTLLRFIAANNAVELNVSSLANDAGFASRTIGPYLDLLETLYLVYRLPAWSANIGRRLVRRPRIAIVDSGLATHLTNSSPASLSKNPNPVVLGGLVEGFTIVELRKLASVSDARPKLHYLREHGGMEVDVLLERRDGGVVAIEIKASSSPRAQDTRWLAQLRDRLGERFIQGVVLHLGSDIVAFGDRIRALPLSAIWT